MNSKQITQAAVSPDGKINLGKTWAGRQVLDEEV